MKKIFNSVRAKLSITLCIVIIMIISFLVIVNSAILETLYYNSKKNTSLETYEYIKQNVNDSINEDTMQELEKKALNNNFDILIIKNDGDILFSSAENFLPNFTDLKEVKYDVGYNIFNKTDILYSTREVTISNVQDKKYGLDFIVLSGEISENTKAYIRISIAPITDSVQISNQFLLILGFVTAIAGLIAIFSITEHFTKPIEQLNGIANGMANLDFSKKYRLNDSEDEINELRKKYKYFV